MPAKYGEEAKADKRRVVTSTIVGSSPALSTNFNTLKVFCCWAGWWSGGALYAL